MRVTSEVALTVTVGWDRYWGNRCPSPPFPFPPITPNTGTGYRTRLVSIFGVVPHDPLARGSDGERGVAGVDVLCFSLRGL